MWRAKQTWAYADKARYTDAFDRVVCCMISGTVFPAFRNFFTFLIVSETKSGLRPKRMPQNSGTIMTLERHRLVRQDFFFVFARQWGLLAQIAKARSEQAKRL